MKLRHKFAGAILTPPLLFGAGSAYVWAEDEVPAFLLNPVDELPAELPVGEQSLICAAEDAACDPSTALTHIAAGSRAEVNIDEIPLFTKQVFIDAEDATFLQHNGISGRGIVRATFNNGFDGIKTSITTRDFSAGAFIGEGGSTITRQVANLKYMPEQANPTTTDKFIEQVEEGRVALKINQVFTKDQQLGMYFNVAPFGRNTVGLEAAAQAHLGISARELTPEQAIMMASMLIGPSNRDLNVLDYSDPAYTDQIIEEMTNLRNSYNHIVGAMRERGHLTADEAATYTATMEAHFTYDEAGNLIQVRPAFIPWVQSSGNNYGRADQLGGRHFIDYVFSEADRLAETTGLPISEQAIRSGGYIVRTTLQPADQEAMKNAIKNDPAIAGTGLDAAGVALNDLGEVVAMVVSNEYSESQVNTAIGTHGSGSGRDAGSQLKPFALGTAYELGIITPDTAVTIPATVAVPTDNGPDWVVSGHDGCDALGLQQAPCEAENASQALKVSSNTFFPDIIRQTGIQAMTTDMQETGMHVSNPNDPATVLGVGAYSPLDLTIGYSAFGMHDGRAVDAHVIREITDSAGNVIYQYQAPETAQVYSPSTANAVSRDLQEVIRSGTAEDIVDPPNGQDSVGGKTGTSGFGDSGSNINLAFTGEACDPQFGGRVASVWMGHSEGSVPIEGSYTSKYAGQMWGNYIEAKPNSGQACNTAE